MSKAGVQSRKKKAATKKTRSQASERIKGLRERYQKLTPRISIERAKYFTEKWRELEGAGVPLAVRHALAMKNVFEKMTIYIDRDDSIAGTWTEFFLGWPLDIERGLYNDVLSTELNRFSMMDRTLKTSSRFLLYMLKTGRLKDYYSNMKRIGDVPVPIDLEFKTLSERDKNPYMMSRKDRKALLGELLPYWKGKTVSEHVVKSLDRAKLYPDEVREFLSAIAATPSRQILLVSPVSALCTYQGHLILDHELPVRRGLLSMKDEVRELLEQSSALSQEECDFLRSIEIALDGVIVFSKRLAEKLKEEMESETCPERKRKLVRMYNDCLKVPLHPAETFRQAVQSLWTVRMAVELAHPTNVHAPGRLDQILYPYYAGDIERGRLTGEEAVDILAELLLKVMVHNMRPESNILGDYYLRFEGSEPVTLAGLTPDGGDATNELTYLILEAADVSRSVINVVVRCHENTPEELYLAVADVLYKGVSNISLMNDEVNVESLTRCGAAPEHARDYGITGCTDLICPGKTAGLSVSGLFLSRLLDVTLRNGDMQSIIGPVRRVGLRTGRPDSFKSFDHLLDAFMVQADYAITKIVEASNIRDRVFAEKMPAPYISAFMEGCLENRMDVTAAGAVYDRSILNMINSVANIVDSLYVIKKLVFEERRLTLKQLLKAVDNNFKGYEDVHRMILGLEGKWGNANPETDELAREITTRLFREMEKHRTYKDGPWTTVINSMTSHTVDGRISTATPDGRMAATPYASSCNPYNVEKAGMTGVLRSVASLDFKYVTGCAVNVRMHPTAIGKTREARKKWAAMMRTYFKMGGEQIQPTVASAETLRAAQKDPDSYRDIIVKVGGYSAYFTELGCEIQNEVIARHEHAVSV